MREPKRGELKLSKVAGKKVKQGASNLAKKGQVKTTSIPSQGRQMVSILTWLEAKGRFQKVPNTLVLTSGETLTLRCKGKAVRWEYPAYLDDDDVEGRLR